MRAYLLPRQQEFVEQYVKDGNGTRAARAAGYSERGARDQAHRLLSMPEIRAAIATAKAQQTERLRIEADDFIQELAALCLADTTEAFDD
jgi:phage terminase small subunit